jgi:RNA polymerase sigma-70 factor (ECF subfamily)
METNINDIFKKIYEKESDAIFRFSLIRVSDREQALDITQETFLRFWKSLQGGEKILNEKAFLFTVARRIVIDWYRKKKSVSLDKMLDNKDEPYDVVDEKATNNIILGIEGRHLLEKIKELPKIYQDSVYLRFVEDLSPEEIGKILNTSANVVSVRINRGLEELRKKTGYNNIK